MLIRPVVGKGDMHQPRRVHASHEQQQQSIKLPSLGNEKVQKRTLMLIGALASSVFGAISSLGSSFAGGALFSSVSDIVHNGRVTRKEVGGFRFFRETFASRSKASVEYHTNALS